MSQIMFSYPAMLALAESMDAHNGTLTAASAAVASEQAALAGGWQGDTGMSYQQWQQQWNSASENMRMGYRAMTDAYRNGTMQMAARDQAEGAKWAG